MNIRAAAILCLIIVMISIPAALRADNSSVTRVGLIGGGGLSNSDGKKKSGFDSVEPENLYSRSAIFAGLYFMYRGVWYFEGGYQEYLIEHIWVDEGSAPGADGSEVSISTQSIYFAAGASCIDYASKNWSSGGSGIYPYIGIGLKAVYNLRGPDIITDDPENVERYPGDLYRFQVGINIDLGIAKNISRSISVSLGSRIWIDNLYFMSDSEIKHTEAKQHTTFITELNAVGITGFLSISYRR